jgi:hypothetical protein
MTIKKPFQEFKRHTQCKTGKNVELCHYYGSGCQLCQTEFMKIF